MIGELTPVSELNLRTCSDCGLQFFDPLIPGDRRFYEMFAGTEYHEATKWEFQEVARRIHQGEDVVDLGCGQGAFLAGVSSTAGRCVGVDIAIGSSTEDDGIEFFEGSPMDYAETSGAAFDVVTAFHVLEHVPHVSEICLPARRLLKRDGRLYVSVPDEERPVMPRLDPLDLPPHHVSRWRIPQLERLADLFELRLERVDHVPARVFPRWLDSVPRPVGLGLAAIYHSVKGARVRYRRLFSRDAGDSLLAQFRPNN